MSNTKTTIAENVQNILDILRATYMSDNLHPWIIAYSGGKDSTLLLHLVWEMLLSLPPQQLKRNVHVIGNDTLVESPLVIRHLKDSMKTIDVAVAKQQLPISTHMTKPYVDQTFWVNIIGRGYIPPTRNFRWCTDRMKITPTNQLLERLVRQHGRAILLIGTRKSESQNRRRTMEKHGVTASTMSAHSLIAGCDIFSPLADLQDNDVWTVLMQRTPPWGGSHRRLITLYRNAGGGDCPLVLTKEDAPSCGTTSPRFGCWTCTVVKKDRSMRGVIDSGHEESDKLEDMADFRDWLIELREENSNRMPVRRNGKTQFRKDGTRVMGPFTIAVRKEILQRLKALQAKYNENLITQSEEEIILDIWHKDQIREDARQSLMQSFGV